MLNTHAIIKPPHLHLLCNRQSADIDFKLHTTPMPFLKKLSRADGPIPARVTSIRLCSFLLICGSFVTGGGASSDPAVHQPIVNLTTGGIARDIAPGERQVFAIALSENQLLRLSLAKGDLALRLLISDDAGHKLIDRVSHRYEVMDVSVVVNKVGTYHIEVSSLEGTDQRHFQLRLDSPRTGNKAQLELNPAQQLIARASWLRNEWIEQSLKQAMENLDQAANIALRRDMRTAASALNEAGGVLFVLGQYREALKRFTMAAECARKAGDKLDYAGALSQMARMHSYLGSNREADESLGKAFNLLDAVDAKGGPNVGKQVYAEALSNRGEINYSKGDLVTSKSAFEDSRKLFSEVGDRAAEARVHLFLGYIAGNIGDREKAVAEISQALALYQTVGNKAGQALCLTALGLSRSVDHDEEYAMKLHREAVEMFRTIGDTHSQATTINALGQAYEYLNEYSEALENYHKALNLLGENPAGDFAAVMLFKIARMHRLLGNLNQALTSYERCLHVSRAAGKRRTEANALNDMALIYESEGSRQKTVKQYGKIMSFYAKISDQRGLATALNNLGDFLWSRGEKKEALGQYAKALAFSKLSGDKAVLISNFHNLARANRDLGDMENALRYIERSIQIIEELRSTVTTPEFRKSYFAGVRKQYELLIDVLMRCEKLWPGRGFAAKAFIASENARARSLIDMRTEAGADIRRDAGPGWIEHERELQGLLRAQAQYQLDLSMQKEDQGKSLEVAKQIDDLRTKYQQLEAQLRDRNPRFLALKQAPPLTIEQIQTELLDEDSVLLEYMLGEERSYLWVVSSTSFSSFELPPRAALESAAQAVYKSLTARQVVGKADSSYQTNVGAADASYFDEALKLSRMLLGPPLSQLTGKRLLVVTEGVLQYIPLDALPMPQVEAANQPAVDPKDLPLLIATHEIVMLPSLSTLAAIRQEKRSRAGNKIVAVLADPVFSSNDDRVQSNKSGPAMASRVVDTATALALRDFEKSTNDGAPLRLTHAAEEAKAIMAVAPRNSAMLAQGFDATRETAISSLVEEYQIVHFAAHGFVNKDHPELSGIVLSMVDRLGNKRSGFMPVRDIYSLNLSDGLVVLSACDTALGKDIKGEGLVGLTHGFMAAGSKSVVASLWKVDDRATSVLMADFYKSMLQDGLTPAAALRSAKQKLRQNKAWSAPYFWAGFVLQGEYKDRIEVESNSWIRTGLWTGGAMGSILILFSLMILHRRWRRSHLAPGV